LKTQTPIVIAIDGTSASGKSTNAKLVAKALGFVHVDTGAMYRTLAWYCLERRVNVEDARAVAALCRRWKTSLKCVDGHVHLLVGNYDPAKEIRSAEVSAAVSHVATVPKVREWMKKKQRECIQFGSLVMEGRDIGTVVFPDADLKVFLTASADERARRRHGDLHERAVDTSLEEVREQQRQRDLQDTSRAESPLQVARGSVVVDTTGLTLDEVVERLFEEVARIRRFYPLDSTDRNP